MAKQWRAGERNETNAGFAAYVGAKRVGWSLDEAEAVELAKAAVRRLPTVKRFCPAVTIFDCAVILVVGFVTDDANGVTYHRRNHQPEPK
jgi:hypothetical protein